MRTETTFTVLLFFFTVYSCLVFSCKFHLSYVLDICRAKVCSLLMVQKKENQDLVVQRHLSIQLCSCGNYAIIHSCSKTLKKSTRSMLASPLVLSLGKIVLIFYLSFMVSKLNPCNINPKINFNYLKI